MKTTEILTRGALNELHLSQLVDQMDPAIGEATTVMGSMVQEIIRRSLRGGVLQIGRELSTYVGQQVELQIVEQRPMIEKTAAEMATEVARGEVEEVRRSAAEQREQLTARIEDSARQAQEKAEIVARDLSGRLEETSRQAHEKVETVARDLSGRLEVTAKEIEQTSEKLTVRIDETARQADEAATSLARTLETEVVAVETRTLDTARTEFRHQLEEVRERARKATASIKERLDKLDVTSAQLAELQQGLKRELLDTLRTDNRRLVQQIEDLRRVNQGLLERVEVLERPRGIRGFFAWLFGRNKKKKPPEEEVVELEGETERV